VKILCTGFTQRAVNSQKLRYDYLTASTLLPKALKALNHEVHHRAVTPGEDLSQYDLAIITVGPPKSLTARYLPGSAWAFLKAKRVILACDDWSIEAAKGNAESTLRCMERFWPWYNDRGKWNDEDKSNVVKMIELLLTPHELRMLAPMFPWGDHKILERHTFPVKVVAWDPTPFVRIPHVSHIELNQRDRQWVLASLQGEPKLGALSWPVRRVGNKRAGEQYIPETEVLELYQLNWGVLCPPYKIAGSGWWRVRYHWSAICKNVLWSHLLDRTWMGEAYQHGARDFEEMTDDQLKATAQAQHDWFFANAAPLQETLDNLREVLK
jgi:hypothetical protein